MESVLPTNGHARRPRRSFSWRRALFASQLVAALVLVGSAGWHAAQWLPTGGGEAAAATVQKPKGNVCTGADPCPVCRSCHACKLCSRQGGSCGVKKRETAKPKH